MVESVENHPSSDTLYVEKINVGGDQPLQIVRYFYFFFHIFFFCSVFPYFILTISLK